MNARQPVGTPKPCFRQERRLPSDAETMFRGTQEHPPTPLSPQITISTRTTTARRCRNHIQGIIPNSPSLYGPSSALGAASRFSLLSNPPNAAERHTSWLLARKEERGSSLPLNPPHPARQGPFFETSSLPTSTRLFPGRVSKRHVDTTLGSEHGSNSLRFHDSRPLPRPRPRPRHQARSPRLRLASASD